MQFRAGTIQAYELAVPSHPPHGAYSAYRRLCSLATSDDAVRRTFTSMGLRWPTRRREQHRISDRSDRPWSWRLTAQPATSSAICETRRDHRSSLVSGLARRVEYSSRSGELNDHRRQDLTTRRPLSGRWPNIRIRRAVRSLGGRHRTCSLTVVVGGLLYDRPTPPSDRLPLTCAGRPRRTRPLWCPR